MIYIASLVALFVSAMARGYESCNLVCGEDEVCSKECSVLPPDDFVSPPKVTGGTVAIDVDGCFAKYCQSSGALASIKNACHQGGYANCDQITYQTTYVKDSRTGAIAYKYSGSLTYGSTSTKYTSASPYSTRWNNTLSTPQQETFSHTITKTNEFSWSNSQTYSVGLSVTASINAKVPLVIEESLSTTFSTNIDISHTNSHSASTTQSWNIDQTINVPAKTCVLGCALEADGSVTGSYTMRSTVDSAYSYSGGQYGGMCCYLRPGGSGDCGGLGPGSSGGWIIFFTPGYAASQGCSNIQSSGSALTFSQAGTFTGGVGFNVSTATVTCSQVCKA